MLVLTRKSTQAIMIGDDIEVSVLSIMGEKVRIGIQASRDIPVFRKEVYLEIQEEDNPEGGVMTSALAAKRRLDESDARWARRRQIATRSVKLSDVPNELLAYFGGRGRPLNRRPQFALIGR